MEKVEYESNLEMCVALPSKTLHLIVMPTKNIGRKKIVMN